MLESRLLSDALVNGREDLLRTLAGDAALNLHKRSYHKAPGLTQNVWPV
jgi:hypothetical protein